MINQSRAEGRRVRTAYPGEWQTRLSPCDLNFVNESPGKGQEVAALSLAGLIFGNWRALQEASFSAPGDRDKSRQDLINLILRLLL